MIQAEAFLCAGLDGDANALDSAIVALAAIVAQQPDGVFAQLALADALRKRYPLSQAAITALERVAAALTTADVGGARADLAGYVAENLAAVERARERTLPTLALQLDQAWRGELTPATLADLAGVLALVGPQESKCAQTLARTDGAEHGAAGWPPSTSPGAVSEDPDATTPEGGAWICSDPDTVTAARALGCCTSEEIEHASVPRRAPVPELAAPTREEE